MSGSSYAWSHEKRVQFERAFYTFLNNCWIESKHLGFICLGQHLFRSQRRFITVVLDGLEAGKHKVYVLKSRQIGLSTISRAFSVFYLGWHARLKGAMVFDSATNSMEARQDLLKMIEDLPTEIGFPGVAKGGNNREGLTLQNNARILFKHAGVKKSKGSGTLGRSVGLSFCHMSEICSFDPSSYEGMVSFERSLSDQHPDRLYIYESTARGYGMWKTMWDIAKKDPHCSCLFVGWWAVESQKIDRDNPDWLLYGVQPPTPEELEKIDAVRTQYGHEVTMEQLAWYRRNVDPTAQSAGDTDAGFEPDAVKLQEDPWTEEDAFQQVGAAFFLSKKLKQLTDEFGSNKFQGFTYLFGTEFKHTQIIKAPSTATLELKVWEEPKADGVYVVAGDPAYGSSETNCRSSVQVLRCWADGIEQVAEYNSPLVATHQLAWVIASLLGWYGSERGAEIRYIIELNGPGVAVLNEMRSLRRVLDHAKMVNSLEADNSIFNVFKNVRTYIYTRPDSMGIGHNLHFKTTQDTKVLLMERGRDFLHSNILRVRSLEAYEEMRTIVRDGDKIGAGEGAYDDRVVSLCLGGECWDTKVRPALLVQNRTREAESARERRSYADMTQLFHSNQLQAFFNNKRQQRIIEAQAAMKLGLRRR